MNPDVWVSLGLLYGVVALGTALHRSDTGKANLLPALVWPLLLAAALVHAATAPVLRAFSGRFGEEGRRQRELRSIRREVERLEHEHAMLDLRRKLDAARAQVEEEFDRYISGGGDR